MAPYIDTQDDSPSSLDAFSHVQPPKDTNVAFQYWEELFRSVGSQPRLACLPLDHQWPRAETTVLASDGLLEAAMTFGRAHNISLEDLIYAVWAIVSARQTVSGQSTVLFTVTGRSQPSAKQDTTENGGAEQHYPLVLSVPEDVDVLSWVRHVGTAAATASALSYIGYDRIMERASGMRPQVKVSVTFEDDSHDTMAPDDDFPLVFNIIASASLKLSMRHNATVPRGDVRALLDRFAVMLQRVTENHDAKASSVDIMPPAERQLLLDYGKAPLKPKSGMVHSLVEEQAKVRPDAAAVQFETESPLTYSALNKRSNQLARQIRQYGAKYIAVHLRMSTDFIVALLAILKSGAAYVILDPDAPAARKSFILEDLQPGLVLVDHNTAGELDNEVQIANLLSQSSSHDTGDLLHVQDPSSVAYVIYTSGSTGKPKPVLLEHQAAFNGLLAFPPVVGLRQLLFFNPAFSAAQRSIWATLAVGGCLCLASKENLTVHTAKMINTMDINSVDMTSSAAALISPDDVPSLRRMVLGGEMVNPAVIPTWEHRVELLSSYGLSECTQLNWRHRLQSNVSSRMIGQPFDTTTSYILIPGTTELAPLLVPGELCLGGAQLARGYLHRPEETTKRFIPNPFGKGRLYRTGDMAVRHADGSVELVGRIDFQVKINGHRVDPGEPNSIIQAIEEVEDSAVVPASVNNRTVLVAAVVSRPDTEWEALVGKLRPFLAARLPLYMVPQFWVSMPALPVNANGKVDMMAIRKTVEALGESGQLLPERSHLGLKEESDLTDNEKAIRSLWAKVLPLSESEISLEDSFISLGGTSLEAIQVVSQLQVLHGLSLRVEDILLGETLSQVAAAVQPQLAEEKADNDTSSSALFQVAPSIESLGISISGIEDAFPVTPFQEAAIANTMMGGTSYIYSRSYSFEGYSQDDVKAAFETLMKSDGWLRTTYVPHGTSFLQVVKKTADLPWETSDMDMTEYMQKQTSKAMHPGELWWNAAALPNDVLVITAHHALFDFWSNEFLTQDLTSVLQGTPRIQRRGFRPYVEYLQQHDAVAMQKFWQEYLDGAVPSRLGSQVAPENTVAAEVHCDLKSTASQRRVTPGVLLYAAWAIVLGLANSTDDVVMGVTFSGRDAPVTGVLQMSGPTLMVAPLRVKVNKSTPLDTYLENVQSNLWAVASNAPYGLRKILKASGQPKDLFDTMANFLIKIPASTPAGGLRQLPESNLGTVEYSKVELRNESLNRVTLTSTLEPGYAQALADTLAAVLDAASDGPVTKLEEFKLVQPVPRLMDRLDDPVGDVPVSGAQTIKVEDRVESPDGELAHSALQRIAASHPSWTAVEDISGARITYAGLAIKMNQLAGCLRKRGLELEQIVPIMLEKSINTIIAMFGILVAGGAFLPLGPENPRERNLGILEDCGAKLVITDKLNAEFFKCTSYEVIVIDAIAWDTIPLQRQIVPGLNPNSLATGKPKGTLIPHSAIVAALEGILYATTQDNSRRIMWSLNYTFDGSFYPLFPTLATGRTLCVAPQNTIVGNLAEVITKMKVDQINLTPTMASLVHPDDVPTLEILATGGEPVTHNMLNVWAPRIKVYTSYGPTEATICVTTRQVTPDMNIRNVGRPFPNTTALILDPDTMEELSSGSVGELCIAGPQLARGYLNRPEATNKAFQGTSDRRFYRTGDLARLLPNGEIELFGRKDDQVKINGHRMELGEIESVIRQTNVFSQCAVIAATVLKKKQLVAFCSSSVQTPGEAAGEDLLLAPTELPGVDQIKAQLTTLPQYMVPTIWLPVSKLPSLTSGKIDRKRLTALVEGMADSVLKSYLPHSETSEINSEAERELQSLWSALFDTPAEDIHANSTFHALGGDSISALNLGSMLRRRGYKIQINDILSSSTLREQAALMVKDQPNDDSTAAETVQQLVYRPSELVYQRLEQIGVSKNDVEDIYPCSPGQIEFFTQGEKPDRFWQLMAVRTLPDGLDFDRWIYLTTQLTKNNQILRALYLQTDSQNAQTLVQVVLKHPVLNLVYRSYRTEEEKQSILEAEWQRPFDPAKPFVRYTLLEDSQGTRHLVINLHHSSYDGTLLHIFDDQFQALNQNQPIQQPTPFKDFITHFLRTPKQPQLDYWTRLLQNHYFDFPSTVTEPKLSSTEVAKIDASLGINDLASSTGVTAPIVFQTAYSLLLAHLSGARDVIYDNLVTGRNVALDNPQLINGNCANFLPYLSYVADDMPIETLLRSTQADFWASTENGLVSLGEIYEALGRDRSTAAAKCLFCFQPFEPVTAQQDPMRWVVMKMSKNRMTFNYAIQMEVVKAAAKGEYLVRFGYDERAFSAEEARTALAWYTRCLDGMVKSKVIGELGV
ncbi:putative nonribosomal peptide synthase [Aspergillus fischeri NRRL 181]|uniref:Nonribosomal peptide synthase, putative n=1 Tax=Neosartorya fischeri (strain ATCC 1020 / DSM 3700 / CBS 544.65 / FGSC A1164 / JCM 1740 / NRRL 181 / WB 181) TaxID=331117 RepID=A1D5M7_NEOFI|nr:nonribosomal peptide synthase, putative [Aspergillus fischeri NRRL 181]EAW21021.1 nonribosomal peptide synthase, putative [Aspergillus fischeri NRRL 181]